MINFCKTALICTCVLLLMRTFNILVKTYKNKRLGYLYNNREIIPIIISQRNNRLTLRCAENR